MAASPVILPDKPLWVNANTLQHTANSLRHAFEEMPVGPGVVDNDSFKVRQRVAGAQQNVDVTAASVLNRAWLRHNSTLSDGILASTDAGMYRIDQNNATPVNVDIAAADATNPRIDQIYLTIEDSQVSGLNNQASVRVVTGVATGGATLDNRTGAAAAPSGMASILLADILVPALSSSVVTANIRDRRPVAIAGTLPWLGSTGTQIDAVSFTAYPVMPIGTPINVAHIVAGTHDNMQAAVLAYLPRRIVSATKIRWKYRQNGTAIATTYNLFIADVSGRTIVSTGAVAFTGAANSIQVRSDTITATTFEVGWYYVGVGLPVQTVGGTVDFMGWDISTIGTNALMGPHAPNIGFRSTTGGTTIPTTILAMTDASTLANSTQVPSIPAMTLSVT